MAGNLSKKKMPSRHWKCLFPLPFPTSKSALGLGNQGSEEAQWQWWWLLYNCASSSPRAHCAAHAPAKLDWHKSSFGWEGGTGQGQEASWPGEGGMDLDVTIEAASKSLFQATQPRFRHLPLCAYYTAGAAPRSPEVNDANWGGSLLLPRGGAQHTKAALNTVHALMPHCSSAA